MAIFLVEAIDNEGNKLIKIFNVDKENEIFTFLEFAGLVPVKIKRLPSIFKFVSLKTQSIKKQEIIEVLENLHLIVKSGLPLNAGIMDLAKDAENNALKDLLLDIAFKIQIGYTLSKAVEKYKNYFSNVVISLFKIGEETGSLDKALKDASEHLKKIEDLKSKTKQAMIYPAFAFTAILGAMIFWLVYVLPKMIQVFNQFDMELPLMTKFIMKLSAFAQKYILLIIIAIFISLILLKLFRKKSQEFKYYTDKILLKIPIFGMIIKNFNFAFFAEYIKLMISAGLPLYQALEIMENAMNNEVFKKVIHNAKENISLGKSFSEALREHNLFPPLIIRMINVGEQTGQLENQLKYISDYYYNKVDYISQNIAKMIEPILIGVLGLFLLILVLGLIGPIYQLVSNLSKMG